MKNRKIIFNFGLNLFLIYLAFELVFLIFNIKLPENSLIEILLIFLERISTILMIYPGLKLYLYWVNHDDKNNDEILDEND